MSDRARGSVRADSREGVGAAGGESAAAESGSDDRRPPAGEGAGADKVAEAGAAPARAGAASPPAVDGTQVITLDSVPSGVFAAQSSSAAPPVPPRAGSGSAVPGGAPPAPDSTQAVPLPTGGARSSGAPGRSARAGAASPEEAGRRPARGRGASRGPRRARLQLRHIDTWSALKISLVVSIALFFVWMVAVGVLFGVLNGLGVPQTLNELIGQLGSVGSDSNGDSGGDVITAGVVFGGAAVIGAINVFLLTALCTVSAVVYNLCSDLVGGLEVTLAERE